MKRTAHSITLFSGLMLLMLGLITAGRGWAAPGVQSPELPVTLQPSSPPVPVAGLTLRDIEKLALEKNLNLQAETMTTRASESLVRKGYGIYDPTVSLFLAEGQSRDLTNNQFDFAPTGIDTRDFSAGLSQKIFTGAELRLAFDNRRQSVFTDPKPILNPEYNSELGLSLVQPLLKNFGRTVTEQEILFAIKDQEISLQDLQQTAMDLVRDVRSTYFNVLRARDDLAYRKTSVQLAEMILAENRARVDAGVLPPVEVLEAEVGVQRRVRDRLDAERVYRDSLDQLALLLNLDRPPEVAAEVLGEPKIEVSEDSGFELALERRPELQRSVKQTERLELERSINRNQMLPTLDLEARYAHRGIGEDYNDAVDDIPKDEIRNWQVGVNVSYPIGNRAARSELNRTEYRLKSQQARLGQIRNEIRTEIRNAIRLLDVNRSKIAVVGVERQLAEEKLRILLGRKDVGLATTRAVLEGEEDLAQARTDQISALADFNIAVSDYYRATGELLDEEGIRFQETSSSETAPFTMD
jgi:outer membrane protein TolC